MSNQSSINSNYGAPKGGDEINYFYDWIFPLLCWDGILPGLVISLPWFLVNASPQMKDFIAVLAVVAPPILFFIRLSKGLTLIQKNRCHWLIRSLQRITLVAAIAVLIFIDSLALMILSLPKQANVRGTIFALNLAHLAYLLVMSFVIFPGISKRQKFKQMHPNTRIS